MNHIIKHVDYDDKIFKRLYDTWLDTYIYVFIYMYIHMYILHDVYEIYSYIP